MDRPGRRQSPVSIRSVGRPSIRIRRTAQDVRAPLCAACAACAAAVYALEGARRHASASRRAAVLAAIDAAQGATTWDIGVAPGARFSRRRR